MWPAPTAEDWKKPVGITFQRTWEDATALAQETNRAILICVNMDGEIASEHYAGIRYRQPDISKLYEPYVCVIASTYRHTPHDYDESGRRILCPRFGSVTCGEHISIEPFLFKNFMEGKRIAPRHICVELDGKETYDVYHTWDTASVFKTIEDGIVNRVQKPKPQVKGDRTLIEKVASPNIVDRIEVEEAFAKGDKDLKRSLLLAALQQGAKAPEELIRMGLFGFDEEMNALARKALSKSATKGSTDLIAEALSVPLRQQEKKELLQALDGLGKTVPKAKRLAQVQRGLSSKTHDIAASAWNRATAEGPTYTPATHQETSGTLASQDEAFTSDDPAKHLALARAFLTRAMETSGNGRDQKRIRTALLEDACSESEQSITLGANTWGATCVLAVSHYYLGNMEAAYSHAVKAAKLTPDNPQSRPAMIVMGLFAEYRRKQISDAIEKSKDWPKSWLTDLHTAYEVLGKHPYGTDSQVGMHYDFLMWLGARGKATRALRNGMKRFPASPGLHNRFVTGILKRFSVDRLESTYANMLKRDDAHKSLPGFAGYASLIAAEFHRRAGRSNKAITSYKRAISLYNQAISADTGKTASSTHYIAMAHGGMARVFLEDKNDEAALGEVLTALKVSQASAATLDGLNVSCADTAKMLRQRLIDTKNQDLFKKLDERLKQLPPELLKLPAYEFGPTTPDKGKN